MISRSDGLDHSDPDAPVFVISVAARLAGMHPQTLRTYDRMGLVSPRRARGRGRRYSRRDVSRLLLIQRLSQEDGVNLPGIDRILGLQAENEQLRSLVGELAQQLRQAQGRSNPRVFRADPDGSVRLHR